MCLRDNSFSRDAAPVVALNVGRAAASEVCGRRIMNPTAAAAPQTPPLKAARQKRKGASDPLVHQPSLCNMETRNEPPSPVEHPDRTPWWSSLSSPPVESLGRAPRWLDGKLLASINEESPANQGVAVTRTALTGRKMQCEESQWHFPRKPPNGEEPTMRKGSYSEELVRIVAAMSKKKEYPSKIISRIARLRAKLQIRSEQH